MHLPVKKYASEWTREWRFNSVTPTYFLTKVFSHKSWAIINSPQLICCIYVIFTCFMAFELPPLFMAFFIFLKGKKYGWYRWAIVERHFNMKSPCATNRVLTKSSAHKTGDKALLPTCGMGNLCTYSMQHFSLSGICLGWWDFLERGNYEDHRAHI